MLAASPMIRAMARHLVHWTLLTGVSLALWTALAVGLYLILSGGA
jgi:hypothetical protein